MQARRFKLARLTREWRKIARLARGIHLIAYVAWCIFGVPLWLFAVVGYLLCLLVFPTAMLSLGLAFTGDAPGAGWVIWASIVGVAWLLFVLIHGAIVIRQFRNRTIDLEALGTLILTGCACSLAIWFIQDQFTA